jgi:hypothetical protein
MPARAALSMIVASLMAQAYATALDGGALVLYDDTTAAPATPEDAVPVDAVELARFPLPSVNAATVVDGVATVAPLGPIPWAASGRVGWARVETWGGAGLVLLNVGTVDEALVVTTLDAVQGEDVTVVAWAFQVPALVDEAA